MQSPPDVLQPCKAALGPGEGGTEEERGSLAYLKPEIGPVKKLVEGFVTKQPY